LYTVTRSASGQTVTREGDGSVASTTLDVRTLVMPRILSQGQIARIAKEPAAQRRELDALLDLDKRDEVLSRIARLDEKCGQLQSERKSLDEGIASLPAKETQLQTVLDQLKFLEKKANKTTIGLFQQYEDEARWLDEAVEAINLAVSSWGESSSENEGLAESLSDPPEGPNAEWTKKLSDQIAKALADAPKKAVGAAESLRAVEMALRNERTKEWAPGFKRTQSAYEQLQAEMSDKGVDFDEHEKFSKKRIKLEKEVKTLKAAIAKLAKVRKDLVSSREQLIKAHEARHGLREKRADALMKEGADVQMKIALFGDRAGFVSRKEEWFPAVGMQDRDWSLLLDYVYGGEAKSLPNRISELVMAIQADVESTRSSGPIAEADLSRTSSLLGDEAKLTGHYFRALANHDRLRLDGLEVFLPDDRVEAEVRDREGNWKPIDQGSMGLKNTAVLSLLLAGGVQPLVIDQPEEDLDNEFVVDVVVDLLRRQKFARQIIVSTHNPNIPVNGDAEQIVALGVEDRVGRVMVSGSIDFGDVKEAIVAIMEGGRDAFSLRHERYGY
jgi:prefoldin subunit 5